VQFGRGDVAFDPRLPPWEPLRPGPPGPLRVRVGASTWTQGFDAYPSGPRRLAAWSERYGAIELNSTFHALPALPLARRWAGDTPPAFRFCAKVPRSVSHGGADWAAEVAGFRAVVEALGDRAGPWFFQAPPEAGPLDQAELRRRLGALVAGGGPPGALELRHPDFFTGGRLQSAAAAWMADLGLSAVVTDTPARRDVVHGTLPTDRLILRLLVELHHPSTPARFAAWGEALRAAEAQGLREAHIFVHQPDNRDLPALIEGLEAAVGGLLLRPAPMRQASLFPPARPHP
jgi:uncharacterized protein YecE (DUF72 family)